MILYNGQSLAYTVGYKELLKYFRGEWSLERAIEMIQQNSRHYAKRQMTWWRRTMNNITDNQQDEYEKKYNIFINAASSLCGM